MASKGAHTAKRKAPDTTHKEVEYYRDLIERAQTVRVRLTDNSEYTGVLEYFDLAFVRLTRRNEPNMFVYKHDIKYIYEVD